MVVAINYVQEVTKVKFDMIITIMLHDACHDFDNGKSDAAFKEYFFSENAIPNNAFNRLNKIKSALGVSGGGGGGIPAADPPAMDGGGDNQQHQIKVHNLQELHQYNSI